MNILVLGGDERNFYLTERLISLGHCAKWCYAENFEGTGENDFDIGRDMSNFDTVVLPLPLTRDGKTLNAPYSGTRLPLDELRLYLKNKTVFTSDSDFGDVNYFSDKSVIVANARLTAVGFLSELLKFEKSDILGKNALVTGYGNVSECVSKILSDNGVNVFVAARSALQRAKGKANGYAVGDFDTLEKLMPKFDYIVNTVPAKVLPDSVMSKIRSDSAYFELASYGEKETKTYTFAYIDCKGMPGKHTPKGAGEVIADFVCSQLRE